MDSEAARLLESSPSFADVEAAARRTKARVRREGSALHIVSKGISRTLRWPPGDVVPKLAIVPLVRGKSALLACPTKRLGQRKAPPFLPGCVKAAAGFGGSGFSIFRDRAAWNALRASIEDPDTYVVQPLLEGPEMRATVCASGHFAVARLTRREGQSTLWRDASARFPKRVLAELLDLVADFAVPGAGFDLMRTREGFVLLDVNLAPSLRIHLATDKPRDLAPAFLEAWLALTPGQPSRPRRATLSRP